MNIRKALMNDAKDIYDWRNHPEVRKMSFDSNVFSWDSHIEWFKRKKDSIYIFLHENKKIGSVRFDEMPNVVKINVMVNPEYFGKKYGNKIIKLGTETYMREHGNGKPIVAEIKGDNIASLKAFEKAGYICGEKIG